jgi:hypothetical protein
MRIQSFASGNLFWRAFNPDDTSYVIGIQEGIISPNQSVDYNHPTRHNLKIEIKIKDIHGELILPATLFPNSGSMDIHDNHLTLSKPVFVPNI